MPSSIRLYVDENLSPEIARQLKLRGVDAVSVRDLDLLGETDDNHFVRASKMGRVLVTSDEDFLIMTSTQSEHAGIIYGKQQAHSIGDWVKGLELICFVYNADDMKNRVEFL
ncbi:MAG: DUF5615 family PIN-like protein [Chloroflexi bacterium]|nr:DUF5615 family PIN-like protein [Chloroflexota bacterium]MCC6896591.1 DUF5615 family PIN-like protein [Anaerolineae bacterium]